jgi:hypothetical protein
VSGKAVIVVLVSSVLVACSAMGERKALYNERVLAAAGFQMKFATSPAQVSAIAAMPQRKLVPVEYRGEKRYAYADAAYCKCMYAGTQAAWQRAQQIDVDSNLVEEHDAASLQWDAWGGWGPWW